MREETRKRLERELLWQRAKMGAFGLVGAVLILGAFYWQSRNITVIATTPVGGTVIHVGPPAGKYKAAVAQTNMQVDVKLDDARVAHLMTPRGKAPKLGEHVTIADHLHGSGRHTFAWQ